MRPREVSATRDANRCAQVYATMLDPNLNICLYIWFLFRLSLSTCWLMFGYVGLLWGTSAPKWFSCGQQGPTFRQNPEPIGIPFWQDVRYFERCIFQACFDAFRGFPIRKMTSKGLRKRTNAVPKSVDHLGRNFQYNKPCLVILFNRIRAFFTKRCF